MTYETFHCTYCDKLLAIIHTSENRFVGSENYKNDCACPECFFIHHVGEKSIDGTT